jgi:anhydro-N-acetylmuramic acid kinase
MSCEAYLGVMSGTSFDGVDVAVVELGGSAERPDPARVVAFHMVPYEQAFRARLQAAAEGRAKEEGPPAPTARDAAPKPSSASLSALNFELGERFAEAILETLEAAGLERAAVRAIGSHGQTVWHDPPAGEGEGRRGSTLQIGEAAVIAERTELPVIADFRVRDVAAGGHGAPLTPYFDRLLLSSRTASRAVQNIGGMANVTALPPEGDPRSPVAFDTGPGVALLDAAVDILTGGRRSYDRDGEMAERGRVLPDALRAWLEDPFFAEEPPRSTGRERFGRSAAKAWLAAHRGARSEDLIATLTELTARSVAEAYRWIDFEIDEVALCGGGARNPQIRRRLAELLAPRPVRLLEELGWDGRAREAAAFALLARQHLLAIPVDVSWATGAAGPRVLGKRVPA